MQATATATEATASELAHDLYGFVVFLHKTANSDLFRTVAELELSLSQVKVLHILDREDAELTLKELGERVGVSLAAASRSVEGLHQRGFVHREEDAIDRRMKRVGITGEGQEVTRQMHAARLSDLEALSATLSAAERRRLSAALAPVLARPEVASCRPRKKGSQ